MTSKQNNRLLYIINDLPWFFSHRLAVAKSAKAQGYDVIVAAHGATLDDRFLEHGFKTTELPTQDGSVNLFHELKILGGIRKALKTHRPDLVHAITLRHGLYTGLALRTIIKPPRSVITLAGLGHVFSSRSVKNKIIRFCLWPFLKLAFDRKSCQIIVQNKDDLKCLKELKLARSKRIHLIPGSGVNIHKFSPKPEPPIPPFTCLLASRLLWSKGIRDYAEAIKILKDKGHDIKAILAGNVDHKNPQAIKARDLDNWITDKTLCFEGHENDMPKLIANSHCVVLPSTYGEGIPKILLEACASARPIVTYDHVGCRDIVEHHVNGMLVEKGNVQALADAIEHLMNNPELRLTLGANGRQKAEEIYQDALICEQTLTVYSIKA